MPESIGSLVEIELTPHGLQVNNTFQDLHSLDIYFHERRIWSFAVEGQAEGWFPWPRVLGERLFGSAEVAVVDSESGRVYVAARMKFDDTPRTFRLVDSHSRPLMINKWLRLAPMLADGQDVDMRDDLVELLAQTRDSLLSIGEQVFAVGGTVLGPYRDGDLLAHDDDGDLAVFFDTFEPVDVALGMLRIQRELHERGFRVRAHSHAHLQVYPPSKDIDSTLYVDIFAAFFRDRLINQPFHVRGPFRREQLLPFSTLEVRGETFSAPADVPSWLALNYDENWATPQPGFVLETPPETIKIFRQWFGASYNLHRHFWELHSAETGEIESYGRLIPFGDSIQLSSLSIVNLGCGKDPALPPSLEVQSTTATVYALDYADSVREQASIVAAASDEPKYKVLDVNFTNYHGVLTFVASLPPGPFDLYAGFVIEGQDTLRRNTAFWRFARMALLSGGQVIIDHLDTADPQYSYNDPRTWHLSADQIRKESAVHGLVTSERHRGQVHVKGHRRDYLRTLVLLGEDEAHESDKERRKR